jgi:hypothetical protein
MFSHGPPILLEDDLLGGWRTDHCRQPAPMGRPPRGPARIPENLAQEDGLQPMLGGLATPDRLLTRAGAVTHGLVLDRRDIDRGQSAAAHQPRPLGRGTSIGCDAIAGVLRDQGGGHDPAAQVLLRQIPREPGPPGARVVDADEWCSVCAERSDKRVDVALAGADGAQEDPLSTPFCRGIGHGDGRFVDLQTTVKGAGVTPG